MVRVAAFGGSLLKRLIAICHVICDRTMLPFQASLENVPFLFILAYTRVQVGAHNVVHKLWKF